jgi:hypothetical protein
MKRKREILTMGVVMAMATTALARTWTSSDGKNTFEGDFVSATDSKVTVDRARGEITFDISKLSDADQTFVRRSSAAFQKALPKALSGKLVKLDSEGKRYEKFELSDGVAPKYYLVYYSASW